MPLVERNDLECIHAKLSQCRKDIVKMTDSMHSYPVGVVWTLDELLLKLSDSISEDQS